MGASQSKSSENIFLVPCDFPICILIEETNFHTVIRTVRMDLTVIVLAMIAELCYIKTIDRINAFPAVFQLCSVTDKYHPIMNNGIRKVTKLLITAKEKQKFKIQ